MTNLTFYRNDLLREWIAKKNLEDENAAVYLKIPLELLKLYKNDEVQVSHDILIRIQKMPTWGDFIKKSKKKKG